ncbi:ABC-type cobalamin/Fe3+-siderophores transport system ATPase subunit [Salirhabdus euzebyi]|uniref:ABC-type cobalamin/Fe3+-siderophores transport system ATPase subunit n=1 Tax=Salirhabdus euzebyi TaxID=394506 RepID=A0A841PZF8_9BACI|nr:DUF4435 domain-containing protein [Salirhabdus euzebyi]MBB6452771.1 ABC-type cobalamin/Fe3+-siderophores transport system ATPase subunit [Salirhabdus euzebyi]
MSFEVKLPGEENQIKIEKFKTNSLVMIGANGSGKSRLGAWIEQQDLENVHRVSAQRSLIFKDFIELKSYKQSENVLFFGEEKGDPNQRKGHRWNWGKYTTTMVNDFDAALSAIIAKRNLQNEIFIKECKERELEGKPHKKVPITVLDQLYDIWCQIYPHRNIKIEDAQVVVEYNEDNYKGIDMSDGERVALYLIAQCLAVPNNKIIIIDEPEVHIHRSIMNRLWKAIEDVRNDCFFIYITHDTQFAASHEYAKKLWVKEYNGQNWVWEFVNSETELPEQCLLDILGNRKNTIFVEGTEDSFDTAIYREIYNDYYIVPCGSSLNVIEYTKAMNSNNQLHHLKAFGIIDRDFRGDREIEYLRSNDIFVLNIAEVENLFCIEEVLESVNEQFAFQDKDRIEKAKNYVLEERFRNQFSQQLAKAISSQVKYKLTTYDVSGANIQSIKQKLQNINDYINLNEITSSIQYKYQTILDSKDYSEVLRVFNEKGLSTSIGGYFGVNNKEYCELILRLLQKGNDLVINGMKRYLPNL